MRVAPCRCPWSRYAASIEPEPDRRARCCWSEGRPAGGELPWSELRRKCRTLVDNIAAFEKQYGYTNGARSIGKNPGTAGDRTSPVELMRKLRKSEPRLDAPFDRRGSVARVMDDLKHLQLSHYFNIYDVLICAGPWTADGDGIHPYLWEYE